MVNNTESLRMWFAECPCIAQSAKAGINYLSDQPMEYAIFSIPSPINYRENILGERIPLDIQTEDYIFATTEDYSADAQTNAASLFFYQQVVEWIIAQNNEGNLPDWNGQLLSLVPTLTATPSLISASVAQYEIHLKATYRRR